VQCSRGTKQPNEKVKLPGKEGARLPEVPIPIHGYMYLYYIFFFSPSSSDIPAGGSKSMYNVEQKACHLLNVEPCRGCVYSRRGPRAVILRVFCAFQQPCHAIIGAALAGTLVYVHERDFVQDVIRALRLAMMFAKNWRRALMILVRALGVAATEG